jgi:hydroxyacylglutathione hydrolase
MLIHQLYTHSFLRNFTYLIELADGAAIVIDPWDDVMVNAFLAGKGLRLTTIINTHEHWDHTQGNEALVREHGCEVWAHENGQGKIPGLTRILSTGEIIHLEPESKLKVLNTPGHTFAHLCFIALVHDKPLAVFTGDTLFNAGVGNCTNGGDAEVMYHTIVDQFHTLDDQVIVYPGHEYLENNLRFTLNLEPKNQDAKAWLIRAEASDPSIAALTTTIGDERLLNTFFRLDNKIIRSSIGCDEASDKEVFVALRSRRDNW